MTAVYPAADRDYPGNQVLPIQAGLFTKPAKYSDLHLLGAQCVDCGQRMFPAQMQCVRCYGSAVRKATVERDDKVVSLTFVREAPPGHFGPTPHVLGTVEFGTNLQILTHLIGKPGGARQLGDPIESCH